MTDDADELSQHLDSIEADLGCFLRLSLEIEKAIVEGRPLPLPDINTNGEDENTNT